MNIFRVETEVRTRYITSNMYWNEHRQHLQDYDVYHVVSPDGERMESFSSLANGEYNPDAKGKAETAVTWYNARLAAQQAKYIKELEAKVAELTIKIKKLQSKSALDDGFISFLQGDES